MLNYILSTFSLLNSFCQFSIERYCKRDLRQSWQKCLRLEKYFGLVWTFRGIITYSISNFREQNPSPVKGEIQTVLIDSYGLLNAKPIVNGHMTIPANQNCLDFALGDLEFALGDLEFALGELHLLECFS